MLLEGEYKNSHVNLTYNAKAKENSLGCLYFGTCSMETMEGGGGAICIISEAEYTKIIPQVQEEGG